MAPNIPPQKARTAGFHRIRSLEIEGGFLDGSRFDFDDYMSCFIGGRGTGKTTVIEILRWVLDRVPQDPKRQRDVQRLIEVNLGNGTARLVVETSDGIVYQIERTAADEPRIFDEQGDPTSFSLKNGAVFAVDVHGQNEIEEIADSPVYQLDLIDRFVQQRVADIEHDIKAVTNQLSGNALELDRARGEGEALRDQSGGLPDIVEKLKGFTVVGQPGAAEEVQREQNRAVLRRQEMAACGSAEDAVDRGVDDLERTRREVPDEMRTCFSAELLAGPNGPVLVELQTRLDAQMAEFARKLGEAVAILKAARTDVSTVKADLARRHAAQEKRFQELLGRHQQEKGRAAERAALLKKQAELLDKQTKLQKKRQEFIELDRQRKQLLQRLSQLRDDRYAARKEVAETLSARLGPTIRVRVDQFGDAGDYRRVLYDALKGSQLRYASLVERIIERVPPQELVTIVQRNDRKALEEQLEIDGDRAARLLLQLQGTAVQHQLEVVDLADLPVIELRDGAEYKDSGSLSTGQKCTTILPILLLESERPLIVDQPEDNLDNAFVFEAVVKSIRGAKGHRQLIFVTHNPNIPVLGEAGQVFVLESSGTRARVKSSGDVDAVKADIEIILEGGPEAFKRRMERYGH